ncbi:DUF2188 domain-containing protein, partial [Escherichia coli]
MVNESFRYLFTFVMKINLNTICGIEWLILSLYADVSMEIEGSIMGKDQHVVPHDGGWAVKGSGNSKATSVHSTKQSAVDAARGIATNQKSELV